MRRSASWFLLCLLIAARDLQSAKHPAAVAPTEINTLLAGVSPELLQATVTKLAGFGTRHTLSETESPTRGIGAARNWIKAQFEESARASGRGGELAPVVRFDSHRLEPDGKRVTRAVDIVNVVAELPGARPESRMRRVYVIAHYDSRASDPNDDKSDAPGRDTTSPIWQHSRDVSAATTITLPLNKDDFQLGVRSVDRDGYRSVVAFPSIARQ